VIDLEHVGLGKLDHAVSTGIEAGSEHHDLRLRVIAEHGIDGERSAREMLDEPERAHSDTA
jgi:hypothetical protein